MYLLFFFGTNVKIYKKRVVRKGQILLLREWIIILDMEGQTQQLEVLILKYRHKVMN